MKGKGVGPESI